MVDNHREELKKIRTFPSLIKYLRDDMGWPIESDDFEEITFEYTPEELGIDEKNSAKIESIKRLRPLVPHQPWGCNRSILLDEKWPLKMDVIFYNMVFL